MLKRYLFLIFTFLITTCTKLVAGNFKNTEQPSIQFIIKPTEKNAVFTKAKPKYLITIKNRNLQTQNGTFSYVLTDDKNKFIAKGTADIRVKKNSSVTIPVELPIEDAGFYDFTTSIALDEYDDEIRNVCAYKPAYINNPLHRPADFDAFWDKTKQDLAKVDRGFKVTLSEEKSDYAHHVYLVEMQSLDTVKIYGWLTVPKLKKYYPVLLALPGYRVELKPQMPDEFAILALNIRGIYPSTEKVDPKNTEYNLYNIQDKYKYIYRGAYMDCVRALDFISENADLGLDVNRVAVGGGSQGAALALAVSGLDNRISACVADNPIYCDMHSQYEIDTKAKEPRWPINKFFEFAKYQRNVFVPDIINTLDYFDPQNFASGIKCPILVGVGSLDKLAPPGTVCSMFNKLSPDIKKQSEIYIFADKAHEVNMHHGLFRNLWMLEKLVPKHYAAK
jgi:cephalosporin-C deacetylase